MISSDITSNMAALQTQLDAAAPLANATFSTVKAIQFNLDDLRIKIDAALKTTTVLDGWSSPIDPAAIVSGFNGVVETATDESTLSLMRGLVGRVELNVDTIV